VTSAAGAAPRHPACSLRFACAATLLLICGCVAQPQRVPAPAPWSEHRMVLQHLASFDLRGRVAVAAGSDGFNAALRWVQRDARTQLDLNGPLGFGAVRVDSEGSEFTLRTGRGERLDADAARAELDRRLGFSLPLSSLRYWILGVPDPALPAAETVGPQERLDHLEQAGWQVEYQKYVAFNGSWLPQRLTATRADLRVRLLVDQWSP
jgi:outer membrane lipoprotein LolB